MTKDLLRKYLLEYVDEATRTTHFNKREKEVVDTIVDVTIPNDMFLPNVDIELQKKWIINEIQKVLKGKIDQIIGKNYPIGKGANLGICAVAPLGMIKLQPLKGNPVNILITAKRFEGLISGYSYYVTVYDDRLPSIVLVDKNNPLNQTPMGQLQAHINNNLNRGDNVNQKASFIDKSFMGNIIVNIRDFNL